MHPELYKLVSVVLATAVVALAGYFRHVGQVDTYAFLLSIATGLVTSTHIRRPGDRPPPDEDGDGPKVLLKAIPWVMVGLLASQPGCRFVGGTTWPKLVECGLNGLSAPLLESTRRVLERSPGGISRDDRKAIGGLGITYGTNAVVCALQWFLRDAFRANSTGPDPVQTRARELLGELGTTVEVTE